MVSYDEYKTGLHESTSPINVDELHTFSDIDSANEQIRLLCMIINRKSETNKWITSQLKRLAELEEIGSLTLYEQQEKRKILEPYQL